MRIKPLLNRIVVQCDDKPQMSSIIAVISNDDKPTRGKVVAIGPGKLVKGELVPVTVAIGDTVLFPRGSGIKTTVDKQDYYVMHDDDILGIVA